MAPSEPRRAAVLGSPIEHSLSPVLHQAAYSALGLSGWTYERFEVGAAELESFVAGLGPEWAGLSVTMPGKKAALQVADEVSDRAAAVGAANTLVRGEDGWAADCTDVDGVVGALRHAGGFSSGGSGLILGAGGTAAATLAAFAELGVTDVVLAVREPARAADALRTAERVGVQARVERLSGDIPRLAAQADVVVSTLPAGVLDEQADELARAAECVLDVVYHPWPTPLAEAVHTAGGRIATGLDMLLHQAFGQVEQFTGRAAPKEAMRDALAEATGNQVPLPL